MPPGYLTPDPLGAAPPALYVARIVSVVDGDTVYLDVDLGLHRFGLTLWAHHVVSRLARCNAREHDEPGGVQAAANLTELLPAGLLLTADVRGQDNYGRLLVELILPDGRNVTDLLIATHWAAPWSGRGRRPVPPWPRPEDP